MKDEIYNSISYFATLINPSIGYKVKSQRLIVFSTKLKNNLNNSLTPSLTHSYPPYLTPPTNFRRYAYTDISSPQSSLLLIPRVSQEEVPTNLRTLFISLGVRQNKLGEDECHRIFPS